MFASVVIPARNAVDRLLYTLYSLNLQYTPFDQFEVIVMDNASTDGLEEKISMFQAHYPLRYFSARKRCYPHQLLNVGVDKARGEMIVFLAADMIVPRHFIGTHLQSHAYADSLVLTGDEPKRAYSVYYPAFSAVQQEECQKWLEHYPQIKRPHTHSSVVALLDEKQIASGLIFEIAMNGSAINGSAINKSASGKQAAVLRPGQSRGCQSGFPRAFYTRHVSLRRSAFAEIGYFRGISCHLREVEKDLAKRLWKCGYEYRKNEKLVLVHQEHPKASAANEKHK